MLKFFEAINFWAKLIIVIGLIAAAMVCCKSAKGADEQWKITAYCSCVKCCNKSDGITASLHRPATLPVTGCRLVHGW